jgi:hypothetical protein
LFYFSPLDFYSDFHVGTIKTGYVYTPVEDTESPFSPPERAGLFVGIKARNK